ncbi:MAG: ABC transporter permease [Acidimicrobiia bacterium]|nr:ABC transporter permease [Acidimicrobiia bacterium]MDH4307914.1 ABC transporter permease [Acidimicrobiia bacterium]MDH5293777.1 ABC transporter permease [Acidimicrobiia bacterium]
MKVLTIAGANLRRFLRDRSNIFFVFVLPIGIVLLIGAQFSGDFEPTVGVFEAGTEIGASLAEELDSKGVVTVRRFDSEDEMLRAVERGVLAAAVSVPGDADTEVAAGRQVGVGFLTRPDGLGPQLRVSVIEAVSAVTLEPNAIAFAVSKGADPSVAAEASSASLAALPSIEVSTRSTGESLFEGVSGQFDIGASSQLVLFMFLTGLTGSAALIQSRQLGVTTRMVGSPTSSTSIIVGEGLGRFVIVLAQGVYIVVATVLLFRVDWGNLLATAAVLVAFSAVGAGAAMLLGTVFRNDQQAGGVSVVAGIGLAALGGSMLPLELFSPTMTTISRFIPHAWANEAFAEILRRGAGVGDIVTQLGVLAAFAAGLLAIASWRMRSVITRP